jgi:hypothetical protein
MIKILQNGIKFDGGCPYPATVANLKDSIENYKRIIAALSA